MKGQTGDRVMWVNRLKVDFFQFRCNARAHLLVIYNIFCEGGGNFHFVLTWHGDNQENMKHA